MNSKILITYASQGGSTAGIAEAIGQTFSEKGAAVDVLPVKDVRSLSAYSAVMLGSAVHGGKWMPEMLAFIEHNRDGLRAMPTAAFQVCMLLATGSQQYKQLSQDWFAPLHAWISPRAEASFTGALWPDRYPKLTEKLGLRIFLAAIRLKPGDYRDWTAIRAWAEQVSPLLGG